MISLLVLLLLIDLGCASCLSGSDKLSGKTPRFLRALSEPPDYLDELIGRPSDPNDLCGLDVGATDHDGTHSCRKREFFSPQTCILLYACTFERVHRSTIISLPFSFPLSLSLSLSLSLFISISPLSRHHLARELRWRQSLYTRCYQEGRSRVPYRMRLPPRVWDGHSRNGRRSHYWDVHLQTTYRVASDGGRRELATFQGPDARHLGVSVRVWLSSSNDDDDDED